MFHFFTVENFLLSPSYYLAWLAPTSSNSTQNPNVCFWSFEVRTSGCTETIQITSGDFQSYTQALTSPYDDEYGRQFVSCQHRFEGIPSEAYVSVSLHYTYDLTLTSYSRRNEITNLTISNGTASQNFSSSSEYIYIQSTTGITFDIISREDDRWGFVYIFRVLICDDPPTFSNASYNKQIWYNGTQANYTCEPGYMHASDSNSYLTCEVVGYDVKWSEDTIKCVPVDSCDEPPDIEYTVRSMSDDGMRVAYRCDSQFQNTLGDTGVIMECTSSDPETVAYDWTPVTNTIMICTADVCPAPDVVRVTVPCPSCPTSTPCPSMTCPSTTSCPPCPTTSCPELSTSECPQCETTTRESCPECPTCPTLTCMPTPCPSCPPCPTVTCPQLTTSGCPSGTTPTLTCPPCAASNVEEQTTPSTPLWWIALISGFFVLSVASLITAIVFGVFYAKLRRNQSEKDEDFYRTNDGEMTNIGGHAEKADQLKAQRVNVKHDNSLTPSSRANPVYDDGYIEIVAEDDMITSRLPGIEVVETSADTNIHMERNNITETTRPDIINNSCSSAHLRPHVHQEVHYESGSDWRVEGGTDSATV